jgi:hypothetical protein
MTLHDNAYAAFMLSMRQARCHLRKAWRLNSIALFR